MPNSSKQTARLVLEVMPAIMRSMRAEMRASAALHLSVPQFRALGFIDRHHGASLSDVAEHIGLTLPSMSKLIDGLVNRKLVARAGHAEDRRRITLTLTARGGAILQAAHESTQAALVEKLAILTETERATIAHAMDILQPLFAGQKKNMSDQENKP